MPDGYGGFGYQEPHSVAEACERVALHLEGQLLTRMKPFTAELFDQNPAHAVRDREAYSVDVSDFCRTLSHNEDGTPKRLLSNYAAENNPMEDLLIFEDLCTALGTTHRARLSTALKEAEAEGVEVDGFNWDLADPLNPQFVLKQVAEELGLKPINAELPLPLQEAWKALAADTVKRVRATVRERLRDRAQKIIGSETATRLLRRADDTTGLIERTRSGDIKL